MKVKGRCYFVVSVWRNHTHRHRHVGTGSLLQFLGSFLNTKVNELWGSGTTWPTAVVCDSGCAVVFAYVLVVVCNPSIVSRAAQMFCRRMICRFTLCRCDDSVAPYGRGGLWDCERALWLGCGASEQHPGLCLCLCVRTQYPCIYGDVFLGRNTLSGGDGTVCPGGNMFQVLESNWSSVQIWKTSMCVNVFLVYL